MGDEAEVSVVVLKRRDRELGMRRGVVAQQVRSRWTTGIKRSGSRMQKAHQIV